MTPANLWALTAGGVVVAGGIAGAVIWNSYRTEPPGTPANLLSTPQQAAAPSKAAPPKDTPAKNAPTVADLGTTPTKPQPKTEPPAGHGEPPHFDIVRVEPSGDAVLAGKGDPNAKVALLDSGKVVAEAKTDSNGNFVILPPTLKPGSSYDLSLRQSDNGKPATDSKQNVAVSVPAKPSGEVVIALAEPGKPTKLLSAPPKAFEPAAKPPEPAPKTPAAAAPRAPNLAIRSAEIENGTGFYATGTATPGTRIEVYLNGSHLAQVVAGPDGEWSVTVKKGLTGGRYAVRADALGEGDKVVARAEVPFDVPMEVAEAPKPAAPAPAPKVAEAPKPPEKAPEPPKTVAEAPEPTPAPAPKVAEGPKPPEKAPGPPRTVVAAEAPTQEVQPPAVPIAPSTPPSPQAKVPAPQPEVAAAAKAAVAAAPSVAPPTMAVAPPTPPTERKVPPPQQMAVAPARPATAAPTLADAKPVIAPPTEPSVTAATTDSRRSIVPPQQSTVTAEASPPTSASSANAVIDTVETALVVPGDNLWNISRTRLGEGYRYTRIYAANVSQIRNPSLIYPGQVFVVPNN